MWDDKHKTFLLEVSILILLLLNRLEDLFLDNRLEEHLHGEYVFTMTLVPISVTKKL